VKKRLPPQHTDDISLEELFEVLMEKEEMLQTSKPQEVIDFLLSKIKSCKLRTDERFEFELIEKSDGFSLDLKVRNEQNNSSKTPRQDKK
jgi:hypothetical protein